MTGIHVPGVNQHPPSMSGLLRKALADYDATEPGEMFPPEGSRLAAANTLASYVRDLLYEQDTEQGEEVSTIDEQTALIADDRIGIEVDTEPGFGGFLILNLDGERFELTMTDTMRRRFREALDRSEEYARTEYERVSGLRSE